MRLVTKPHAPAQATTTMLQSRAGPSSRSKGNLVADKSPLHKLQKSVVGTVKGVVRHPVGSAGWAVQQAKGTVALGRSVAGQVARTATQRAGRRPGTVPSPMPAPAPPPAPAPEKTAEKTPEATPADLARMVAKKAPAKKAPAKKAPAKKAPPRRRRRRRHLPSGRARRAASSRRGGLLPRRRRVSSPTDRLPDRSPGAKAYDGELVGLPEATSYPRPAHAIPISAAPATGRCGSPRGRPTR